MTLALALCLALLAALPASAVDGLDRPARDLVLARIDSLWSVGDHAAASALADSVLPLARASADSVLLLELLVRRGAQGASFGATRSAEPQLREAVFLATAIGDSATLCSALRWLGVVVNSQGRPDEARDLYRELLRIATRQGDRRHQAWARVGLAWDAIGRGNPGEAIDLYDGAAELFRDDGDIEGEIWARNGLGVALSRQRDYQGAADCYRLVVDLAGGIGFSMALAQALSNLGGLEYSLGDPGLAREHFERAVVLLRDIGQRQEAMYPATNLAMCQMDLGEYRDARENLEHCLAECRDAGYRRLEGMVLNTLATLAHREDRPRESARLLRRSLALGEAQTLRLRVECWIGLSDALARMDSTEAALQVIERGARELEGHAVGELQLQMELARGERLLALGRPRLALEPLQFVADESRRLGLSSWGIRALTAAARAHRQLGAKALALQALNRASTLWEAQRGLPLDPMWREQRGELAQELYSDLADLLLGQAPGAPPPDRVRLAFDRVQVFKARTLEERLRGPGSSPGASTRADTLSLATVALLQDDVLRPGELLLDAYVGRHVSILFAIGTDSCWAGRLPGEERLGERLRLHHEILRRPPGPTPSTARIAAIRAAGHALWDVLLAPVGERITQSEHVIISPDGVLNLTPFLTLSDSDWDPDGVSTELITRTPCSRVPSATVLMTIRGRATTPDGTPVGRVLAIAGSVTPNGIALPGTVGEVRDLGRRYRSVDVLIDPCGADPFGPTMLAGYDMLHLAAHLRVDDQHPWQSAIRLGGSPARGGPGPVGELRAAQVADLELGARLAVLAGCESGGGMILSGEGVLGLSTAFLSSGVSSVVATLWPVDDRATATLMRTFYRELSSHKTAGDALRQAQLAVRARPETADPFYWAGFTLIGDPDTRVPLQERRAPWWLWPVGLVILSGGFALVRLRFRRASAIHRG